MKIEKHRHPFIFYGVAVIVPWVLWFTLGAISHSNLWDNMGWFIFGSILGIIGLCAPFVVAMILILPDKDLRDELKAACTGSFRGIHFGWYALVFLFPFAVILFAQAISLIFGHSTEQFKFIDTKKGDYDQYIQCLSKRELEVVEAILAGNDNYKKLATVLNISVNTIKTHLQHIYQATGISNIAALSSLFSGYSSNHP
jgi:DNA-binding CsgD family transcriptional regulator